MPVTELTPTQAELLEEIQAWWKKHAPSAKVPEGTWVWQVTNYSSLMMSSIKRRLTRLRSDAKVGPSSTVDAEIDSIKEEVDILCKCQDMLLEFANQFK